MSAYYDNGTASFATGSPSVTGTGTNWSTFVKPGALIWDGSNPEPYFVESVDSQTALTLDRNWAGANITNGAYRIWNLDVGVLARTLASLLALESDYATVKNNAGAGRFPAGSLSQAAISNLAEAGTGLDFPALGQMRWQVQGVQKALLDTTEWQLDVPIGGLAVVQSPFDTSAGRLLVPGTYGWGQDGNTQTDAALNSATTSGVIQFDAADANNPLAVGGLCLVMRYKGNWLRQVVFSPNSHEMFTRYSTDDGATRSAWERLHGEAGSNANGVYIMHPDGTLECWHVGAGGTAWTFPASMVGAASDRVVQVTPTGNNARSATAAANSTNGTTPRVWDDAGTEDVGATCYLYAVGRYK